MQRLSETDRIVAEEGFHSLEDNVCILDRDNHITYCNPAWDRFALANGGELATFAHVKGINVLSVCTDQLRGFYRQMLSQCRTTGLPGASTDSPLTATKLRGPRTQFGLAVSLQLAAVAALLS